MSTSITKLSTRLVITLFVLTFILPGVLPAHAAPTAIITVNDTADRIDNPGCATTGTGTCTLRDAIIYANGHSGSTIQFAAATNGIPFTLTLAGQDDNAQVGDLDVLAAVTITGNGPANTIIQAGTNATNGLDKIFSFNPLGGAPNGFAVSISGLTLRYGRNQQSYGSGNEVGGAFDFDAGPSSGGGSLSITNCVITNNSTTDGDGGGMALFDGGTVNIVGTTISNNVASSGSSGVVGGGISIASAVGTPAITIRTSQISNNTVNGLARQGGGIFTYTPLTLQYSRIVANTASVGGSGVYNSSGATVTLNDNWWGQNTGPGTGVLGSTGGSTIATTYLLLRHSASPTPIYANGTSTLTADLLGRNSGGPITVTNLSGLPTFGGTVFGSAVLGTLSGQTQFVDGIATATYTAGTTPGTGSAVATADGQTASASIIIATAANTYADPVGGCSGNTPCFTSSQVALNNTANSGTVTVYGTHNVGASLLSAGSGANNVSIGGTGTLNWTGGAGALFTIGNGNVTIKGLNLTNAPTVFNQTGSGALTAYANNITAFTTAYAGAGTPVIGHNYWGTTDPLASPPSGVSAGEWAKRLGAPRNTWVEGAGTATLGNASLSGGSGTAVIVSYARGLANAPFGNGITPYADQMCSDYYDFFTVGGSGTWTGQVPVDGNANCNTYTLATKKVFWITNLANCSPATNTACWGLISPARVSISAQNLLISGLTVAELGGTSFVAGNIGGNDPTAITLREISATSNSDGRGGLLVLLGLGIFVASAIGLALRRRVRT